MPGSFRDSPAPRSAAYRQHGFCEVLAFRLGHTPLPLRGTSPILGEEFEVLPWLLAKWWVFAAPTEVKDQIRFTPCEAQRRELYPIAKSNTSANSRISGDWGIEELRRVERVERVEDWNHHKSPNPPILQ